MSDKPVWASHEFEPQSPSADATMHPFTLASRAPKQEPISMYSEASAQACNPILDGLFAIAMLVQPPSFMQGGAGHLDDAGQWVNQQGSFDLKAACYARIAALGLDAAKVKAYLTSTCSAVDEHAFWNLSFEARMARFRV